MMIEAETAVSAIRHGQNVHQIFASGKGADLRALLLDAKLLVSASKIKINQEQLISNKRLHLKSLDRIRQ